MKRAVLLLGFVLARQRRRLSARCGCGACGDFAPVQGRAPERTRRQPNCGTRNPCDHCSWASGCGKLFGCHDRGPKSGCGETGDPAIGTTISPRAATTAISAATGTGAPPYPGPGVRRDTKLSHGKPSYGRANQRWPNATRRRAAASRRIHRRQSSISVRPLVLKQCSPRTLLCRPHCVYLYQPKCGKRGSGFQEWRKTQGKADKLRVQWSGVMRDLWAYSCSCCESPARCSSACWAASGSTSVEMPMKTSGAGALLQMLAEAGVRYLFGNPGTTELPLNDALVDDRRIQYILGLQEVPVMAMADGYAHGLALAGRRQPAHQLRPGQRDGHALQRLSRRHAAVGHRRPAGPPADVRGADPVGRHGRRRPAVDQVGGRGGARARTCRSPCAARCRPRSRRRPARCSCRCRSTCRWKLAELDLTPPHAARPPRASAASRRSARRPTCWPRPRTRPSSSAAA